MHKAINSGQPDAALRVQGVSKHFGAHQVLHNVSLEIRAGEVLSIIGPSGSGKSTLLRCINFLSPAEQGDVYFEGRRIVMNRAATGSATIAARDLRRKIGMVFQGFELFPHLTILENATLAQRRVLKRSAKEAEEKAMSILDKVGIANKAHQYPRRCSGGQQQRAAIARALALDPQAILFDEPTSALDPEYGAEVLKVMRSLADGGMTMIVVTHEMGFAREVSDRVVVMAEGKVIEAAEPEELFAAPTHERTRRFLSAVVGR